MTMTNQTRRQLIRGAAMLGAAVTLPTAFGQGNYPTRPIKLVVPYPAGALTDSLGRFVGEGLRASLGQAVVVENRPGAGTLLGASVVAKSPADGYSLMIATTTTLALSPAMQSAPPATAADFVGVAMIGSVTLMLVVRPDWKVRNLRELVAAIAAEPGRFNYASPGNGTMHQVLVEMIKSQEKISATHVPYQGSMPAVSDVMAGRVDFMFLDAVAAMPQIQARKVNVIAIAGSQRAAALPDVPTVSETYPAIDTQAWQAVVAPRATPAAIVERLNAEINRQIDSAEGRAQLLRMGVDANPMSVKALAEVIARDEQRLGALVRANNIKAT
jgi:tripartite-type tricarboxylate transporter receptor subunit TctC